MVILELKTSDVYDVLGRLLDQARVAGVTLIAVSAWAEADTYKIRASVDAQERDRVDKVVRRLSTMINVAEFEVRDRCSRDLHALYATAP